MPTRSAALALTLALSLPLAGAAQAPDDLPEFQAGVSLVLLPVFVVDRDGDAARGLHAEDFRIEIDGDAAEIVSFRYVDTTSHEEQQALREAPAARRRFLLLFDKSFTDLTGLTRAQQAAGRFVRTRLADSDLVAVAAFDVNRGIQIVANFTEDRALLSHAIATLGVPTISKISDPLSLSADLQATDIATPGGGDQATPQALIDNVAAVVVQQLLAAEREQYRVHIRSLLDSLHALADGLRNVEGRKQILYFSAGFDSRLLVGEEGNDQRNTALSIAQGRLWEVDGQARYGDNRLRDEFLEATRALTAADAVVHSIDVTGLEDSGTLQRMTPAADGMRALPGRESLNYVSSETGGRFFRNSNLLGPVLDEMLDMTSRFYILGFQPKENKGPGAFHKVRVKVERRGAKVSHRSGYYERLPSGQQTPLQRQFNAAQLVMTGVGENSLRFASLCLPFPERTEKQTLGLVLQVPRESLPWKDGSPTAVEVYGYAVAQDGSVKDHLAQFVRFDPAQADPEGRARGLSFFGTLSVPAGDYTLKLMLHERESGLSGTQFIDVTVPPYDPRVGFLLPPVLVDDAEQWLRLEMASRDGRPYPFQLDGEPFLPRADFGVQGGTQERMVLIAYEPQKPGDPAAGLQIRSSLVDREGALQPAGRLKIDRVLREDGGRRTYVLSYTPDVVDPGDYTLRLRVGEAGTLLESYALIRVRSGS